MIVRKVFCNNCSRMNHITNQKLINDGSVMQGECKNCYAKIEVPINQTNQLNFKEDIK